jgi:hypothetical protein
MALFDLPTPAVAHQRKIREQRALEEPRQPLASLDGYSVETIGRTEASALIGKYEWLGTMGRSTEFIGLMSPYRELEGAVCFGHGPAGGNKKKGSIRTLIGSPALCLERGACVHWAPPNAASFLISRACKLVSCTTGVHIFFAYADPMAGEYGAVYQATNWHYLGQGLDKNKLRPMRRFVLAPGQDRDNPANWQTTRALRRGPKSAWLDFEQASAAGWEIAWREAKHVYAINIGRDRKRWLKGLVTRPYPAPRPHLKIKV